MPKPKKRDNCCYRAFRFADLYGLKIGFNIDGEDVHRTWPGAITSLFILSWLAVVLRYLVITIVYEDLDQPLTTMLYQNYYGSKNVPLNMSQGFRFAIGLSSVKNFVGQNNVTLLNYAKFEADVTTEGGLDDGKQVFLQMRTCTDSDWANFYEVNSGQKSQVLAHKKENQFWCPVPRENLKGGEEDLSIYNTFDNLQSKVVNIYLTTCVVAENPACAIDSDRKKFFEGKQIMLLTNTQRIDNRESQVKVVKEATLTWFPFLMNWPQTNRIVFQRFKYQPYDHIAKMLNYIQPNSIEYFSQLQDQSHLNSFAYASPIANNLAWSQVQFTLNQDLIYSQPTTQTILTIFPWLGGWFVLMFAPGIYIAHLIIPKLVYLSIVTRLFKTDPSKGGLPRDPLLAEKKTAKELLIQAKKRMRDRRPLIKGQCDLFQHVFATVMCRVFCCRSTKFAKIYQQGKGQIRRQLDLFNFLQTQRQIEATLNALTTFEQRRLIKQQVRAGLLVAPIKTRKSHQESKRGGGKLWDSDDEETSSDEDFNFLMKKMKESGDGNLDPETMKLLRGVIQPPFKERKHPERYERPGYTEEKDEQMEEESDFDLNKPSGAKVLPGKQFALDGLDNMEGLSREEQLRRMNILANEFNFFAQDKPDQSTLNASVQGVAKSILPQIYKKK